MHATGGHVLATDNFPACGGANPIAKGDAEMHNAINAECIIAFGRPLYGMTAICEITRTSDCSLLRFLLLSSAKSIF